MHKTGKGWVGGWVWGGGDRKKIHENIPACKHNSNKLVKRHSHPIFTFCTTFKCTTFTELHHRATPSACMGI